MTDTKHTPGPWKVYRAQNGLIIGIGVDRPNDEDHAVGVTDPGFGLWGDGGERDANARLIAAAPDLLEFAVMFLGWREYSSNGEFPFDRLAETARAAIAKAEQSQ
jgi:hypothetical protein